MSHAFIRSTSKLSALRKDAVSHIEAVSYFSHILTNKSVCPITTIYLRLLDRAVQARNYYRRHLRNRHMPLNPIQHRKQTSLLHPEKSPPKLNSETQETKNPPSHFTSSTHSPQPPLYTPVLLASPHLISIETAQNKRNHDNQPHQHFSPHA